jgi:hypothetical protein
VDELLAVFATLRAHSVFTNAAALNLKNLMPKVQTELANWKRRTTMSSILGISRIHNLKRPAVTLETHSPTSAFLLSLLNTAGGAVAKMEGSVVEAGKVGEAVVLELGAKGLLEGLMQEGILVLADRGIIENGGDYLGYQ